MKLLVLVLSVVAAAYALPRPDVSELGGYNYNNPGGSGSALSGSYLPGVSGGSNILSGGISSGGIGINGGYNGGNNHQEQKHVYFYAAPDDEGPAHLKINIAPSSHKNTKVIFIKAPSHGGVIPEVIAPPSQAEDKTLVYVLVKKQQHGGAITIPSSLGVKSAKPEVFFIKYRNQAEAEQAVQQGLGGQSVGSGLSDLGNEGAFVRTLETHGGGIGGAGGIIGGGSLGGGIIGGGSGDFSGSSILGGSISGGDGGSIGSGKYGVPGASGPY